MKLCFPVERDNGLESPVFDHFGSAPLFIVLDSETGEIGTVINGDREHTHGRCNPLKALEGHQVNAVVVGGIGSGALQGLNRIGIKVYRAVPGTCAVNLEKIKSRKLVELTPDMTCSGHSPGGGCGHPLLPLKRP